MTPEQAASEGRLVPIHRRSKPEEPWARELWAETAVAPGWVGAFRLIEQDDELVIAEARIFPGTIPRAGDKTRRAGEWSHEAAAVPRGGMTTRHVIRRIRTAEVFALARQIAAKVEREHPSAAWSPDAGLFGGVGFQRESFAEPEPRKRGRPRHPDLFLARVAAVYVRNLEFRDPVRRTAREATYAPARVQQLLKDARSRGLLTRPPAGRAGGSLTAKARQLLADTETKEE